MKLTPAERFLMFSGLPKQGDFWTVNNTFNIVDKVKFDPKEVERFSTAEGNVNIKELMEAKDEKDVALTGPEVSAVVKWLEKMDKDKAMAVDHLSLHKKFMGEKG